MKQPKSNRKLRGTKLEIAMAVKAIRAFTEDDIAKAFGTTRQTLGNNFREQDKKIK